MKQENTFTKKIITDIDPKYRTPDLWDFPSMGVRIINKKGQGYIATNLPGNEEIFELRDGYKVLGACQHNGVAYIVSASSSGAGEVGCFPSPKKWTETNDEFVREYSPLQNLAKETKPIGDVGDMNSPLFTFRYANYLDVFAKPIYDGSVNLYLTDNLNPIRVINSSFSQEGSFTGRVYIKESFDGAMNLVASTKKILNPSLTSVEDGGDLPPGMYTLFFRYLTEDYNGTTFIEELGPIQISEGSSAHNTGGKQYRDFIAGTLNFTSKKITIALSNLDESYTFFQIGVMYRSATVENAIADKNTYLINKFYKITGETKDLVITGQESQSTLTFDEIITPRIPYNINKSHTPINNYYIGAGWKRTPLNYDNDKFTEFALNIIPISDLSPSLMSDGSILDFENKSAERGFYRNEDNTHDYAGYLHGEAYPFGVKIIFTDGTETDVFPTRGSVSGSLNDKGIYRFPEWAEGDDLTKTLGVRFLMSAANTYASDAANSPFFDDVAGIRFVRGERIDNFICQGFAMNTYYAVEINKDGVSTRGFGQGTTFNINQALHMPLHSGYMPFAIEDPADTFLYTEGVSSELAITAATFETLRDKKRLGIFAPDVMLGKVTNIPRDIFIKRAYKVRANDYRTENLVYPRVIGTENISYTVYSVASIQENVEAVIVDSFVRDGPDRFTSYLPARTAYYSPGTNYWYNRSIRTSKYIGIISQNDIDIGSQLSGSTVDEFNDIFNLYKNEPTSAFFQQEVDVFNVATSVYEGISKIIPISSGQITLFKGDCFLQKSFFRTHRFANYEFANPNTDPPHGGDGNEFIDDSGRWYQWGFLTAMVTENLVNADMRNEVPSQDDENNSITYSYFPRCLGAYENMIQWTVFRDIDAAVVEGLQVNDGYNHTRSGKQYVGFDENLPDYKDDERPQRLYNSNEQIPGSIVDAFRSIGASNYVDLPAEDGKMTRVVAHKGMLMSIQEHAIHQHDIKERVTQATDAAAEIILAQSLEVLNKFYKPIAKFGSQHMSSVIVTKNGIYGSDWLRSVIWVIASKITDTGMRYFASDNLLLREGITKEFQDLKDLYTSYNDIMSTLLDNPISGSGIVAGYNPKFDEVYFTFTKRLSRGQEAEDYHKTFTFNELLQGFTGNAPFIPYTYFNINDDLFTSRRDLASKINRHDIDGKMQMFYGELTPFKISFLVTGIEGEKNFYNIDKVFKSMRIEMTEIELTQIIYETESQISTYTFLSEENDAGDSFWLHSEYQENEWQVPVFVQTETKGKDYDDDSDMRGHWMKVTLVYDPGSLTVDTGAIAIYIKKVITDFITSNS